MRVRAVAATAPNIIAMARPWKIELIIFLGIFDKSQNRREV
jgi:hypothetical protein